MIFQTIQELLRYKPNANDDWLIGCGFLSRGGSVLICGEPGCGKSKFTQHLAYSLALGRSFLGLVPTRAYKVLYIQAEDTIDDLHESIVGFVNQHGLTKAEVDAIAKNCVCAHPNGKSGDDFFEELKVEVEKHQPDIVITDPLLALVGCDLTNQEGVTEFLREKVGLFLSRKRCGWICVHHTAKGASGKYGNSKVTRALGSVEISAFFRGVIDLERKRGDSDALVMEIAKRSRQAGLRSSDGNPTSRLMIRMGVDGVNWTIDTFGASTSLAVPKAKAGRPAKAGKDDVAGFIAEQRKAGAKDAAIIKAVAAKFAYCNKQARRLVVGR